MKVKDEISDIIEKINEKFNEGKINFFFFILSEHKPIGLENDFIFNSPRELEKAYEINKNKFMKKLRKLYNPVRYKGNKEEQQKLYYIMQEIAMKLNDF